MAAVKTILVVTGVLVAAAGVVCAVRILRFADAVKRW
jgi:hypothetical protein